jgi:outer membrane protein assembly factor BamA
MKSRFKILLFPSSRCVLIIHLGAALMALLCSATPVSGQVDSRAAEVEAARDRKAQVLQPDTSPVWEQRLIYIRDKKIFERITAGVAGFRAKLGGLVTGSGFALGPEYLRRDLAQGHVTLRAAAQSSFKGYQKYDLQFSVPSTQRHPYFLDLQSTYRNYPGINYYGPGPDSNKSSRSDFRLEDTRFNGRAGVEPVRHLKTGVSVGYALVNVGPGTDKRFISADKVFTPEQAPGIDRQPDFFRHTYFVQYDYRDNPGGPRSGGNYIFEFGNYIDRDLSQHDFRRLDVHLQQYIPFFNQRRVIALRAKSTLTFTENGQRVPFYLQPTLGGSDDLRGFRPFRFYDDNLLLANLEYRWETFSGLDMALFADAGKVFPRHSQWNFHDMEASAGFGFRFNVRNNVFLRTDVGFSHEGFQVWIKFNNMFTEGVQGSPDTESIY